MNHLRIIFILITFSVSAALYATPFEQELAQLQEQRAKALATASDPINRRYAVSLEQLLRRATQANDLDSAIKMVEGTARSMGIEVSK